MILAGTGSRSLATADHDLQTDIAIRVRYLLLDKRPDWVMSGMAEGFDEFLALAALNLDIPLWCAVPNEGYGQYYWGQKSLYGKDRNDEFQEILKRATKVTYVMSEIHQTQSLYLGGKHANFVRNDFMVRIASDFLVYDPTSSGTRQCLASIKNAKKPFTIVEP